MIADWPSGSVRARVVRGSQSPEPLFEVTGINICLRKVTGKQGYGPITFLLCSFNTESDLVSLFQLLVFLHNTAAWGILCLITCLKLCLIVVNGRNISFNQQSGSPVAFCTFFPLSVMSLFCREKTDSKDILQKSVDHFGRGTCRDVYELSVLQLNVTFREFH